MKENSEGVVEQPEVERDSEEEYVETCRCGFDRHHHMVSALPTYSAWGNFWLILMGVSSTPTKLDFQCRVCGEKFDFTTRAEELKQFI